MFFYDEKYIISQKLAHLTSVFNILKNTLHAWHDSWFYSTLHQKMNTALIEFQTLILNLNFSTFLKKKDAIEFVIHKIEGSMDSNFMWYAHPDDVPLKIISAFNDAKNKL